MPWKIKHYGNRAYLICELGDETRLALLSCLSVSVPEGLIEYVEGYDSILLSFEKKPEMTTLTDWLESSVWGSGAASTRQSADDRIHEVLVEYNGPDLDQVARALGLSNEEVVQLHSGAIYRVRFMGFSPGFPYLDGLSPRLHLPRKAMPRKRIAAGSVAIGGSHAGIYTVDSPGGWHLLGQTKPIFFNQQAAQAKRPDAKHVFQLQPGDQVRFVPAHL